MRLSQLTCLGLQVGRIYKPLQVFRAAGKQEPIDSKGIIYYLQYAIL